MHIQDFIPRMLFTQVVKVGSTPLNLFSNWTNIVVRYNYPDRAEDMCRQMDRETLWYVKEEYMGNSLDRRERAAAG